MSTLDGNVTDIASELDTSLGSAYSIGGDQKVNHREVGVSSVPQNFTYDHTTHTCDTLRPKSIAVPTVPCYKGRNVNHATP